MTSPVRTLALLFLLLAAGFAGCFGATDEPAPAPRVPAHVLAGARLGPNGTSEAIYDTILHEIYTVPSFDGVNLVVDVWRPKTPEGVKVPGVAVISPYMGTEVTGYRKDPERDNYPTPYGPYRFLVDVLAPAGYAIALVDLRGTRESEGCIDLNGLREQRDSYEIVEWLATQNWSSGRVGMIGKSYDGMTTLQGAVGAPPHLVTLVPMAPVSSWYQVEYMGGAHYTTWSATPALYTAIDNTYLKGGPESPGWIKSTAVQGQCVATNNGFSNDPTGDNNAYLQERDLRPRAGNVTASVFWVHGFLDANARIDNMGDFFPRLASPKKGYFWQAPHEWPTYEYETEVEEWSGRGDFWRTVHRWFDHWLLQLPNGMNAELNVQVQDNLGRWRNETDWPPADAVLTPYYLAPEALVEAPPAEGSEAYTDDAGREGALIGNLGQGTPLPIPRELRYETEALTEPVHASGTPTVTLTVSADKPNTHYHAILYDIDANGTWHLVNRGVLNLRHRNGIDHPTLYTPDEEVTVTVSLYPMDYVWVEGNRIGLVVKSSDPEFVIPPGTSATSTVRYGGASPSSLDLPLVTRGESAFWLTSWGENQPRYLGDSSGGSP